MNQYVISALFLFILLACNKAPSPSVLSRPTPNVNPYVPIAGIQDMSFGVAGEYKFAGNSGISLLTQQKNGKLLGLKSSALEIYRLSAEGAADLSFGTAGKVTIPVSPPVQELRTFYNQVDGKSIVGGTCYNASSKWSLCIFRILEDGQLDITFGVNGKAMANISGNHDFMTKLVPNPLGGFYAVGYTVDSAFQNSKFLVAKFSDTGALEISGIITWANSSFQAAVMQPDGKLIASGNYNASMFTTRFSTPFTFDPNFAAPNGYSLISNSGSGVLDNAIQGDGKILVSGSNNFGEHPTILRLTTDGNLDSSYGSGGIVTLSTFGGSSPSNPNSLSKIFVEPSGKILAFAQIKGTGGTTDIGMTRLNTDGSVDNTFGTNGFWEKDFYTNSDFVKDMLVCTDGKVFLLTQAYNSGLGQVIPTIIKMK